MQRQRSTRRLSAYYDGWRLTNDRLTEAVESLNDGQLALRAGPGQWPIWAIASHTAGARVYWLCYVLKEPGAEKLPYATADSGWEDDPDHPRTGAEVASALRSSWAIVQRCLEQWTPEMLADEFERRLGDLVQVHTRQSVLMRLITHDAYHAAEVSLTLGVNGLKEIDLWLGRAARTTPA